MNKFEKTYYGIYILGLLLEIFNRSGGKYLVFISLVLLIVYYSIFTFYIINNIPINKMFKKNSYKIFNIFRVAFSIFCQITFHLYLLGLYLIIYEKPFRYVIFINGAFFLFICLIISVINYFKTYIDFYKFLLMRIITFIMFFFLYLITLVD